MCFGPYTIGSKIPKPFRDIGGNCIVFALPPLTSCPNTNEGTNQPKKEVVTSSMVKAGSQGTCNNPPKIGKTLVVSTNGSSTTDTANSPFQIVAAGPGNINYSAAIPQGNF